MSLAVLLGLVLAVTTQLITGFFLMARPSAALLVSHIVIGLITLVLVIAEWTWLAATRAGRHRLAGFLGAGTAPAQWTEAGFLVAVTITVVVGAVLAAVMHFGPGSAFGPLLGLHRALAIIVAVLYLLHSFFAMRSTNQRRTPNGSP